MARKVQNSRFSYARNIILVENMRLRSSPLLEAAKRYVTVQKRAKIASCKQITYSQIHIFICRKFHCRNTCDFYGFSYFFCFFVSRLKRCQKNIANEFLRVLSRQKKLSLKSFETLSELKLNICWN